MTQTFVVAQSKIWNVSMVSNLRKLTSFEVIEITNPTQITFEFLNDLNPKFVFFPHWSALISKDIYANFKCIIFHMTDLPFGRGGSPLQNLIKRGFSETKMCAIECVEELDAGPIYLKSSLSLDGSAQEIYCRAATVIEKMIVEIVEKEPQPTQQVGEVVVFKRRTPNESNIGKLRSVDEIYDAIRMLDADGYPHAFIEFGNLKIEFRNAKMLNGRLLADSYFTEESFESKKA
jgi:methionyl-tRNA formyltransferase